MGIFEEVVRNTLEWKPVNIDTKQPTTTTITTNKGGMHKINSNFENDVRMTVLVQILKALETSKEAQSSAPEPSKLVVSPILCPL